jgi:hypothetical protein
MELKKDSEVFELMISQIRGFYALKVEELKDQDSDEQKFYNNLGDILQFVKNCLPKQEREYAFILQQDDKKNTEIVKLTAEINRLNAIISSHKVLDLHESSLNSLLKKNIDAINSIKNIKKLYEGGGTTVEGSDKQ